MYVDIGVTRKMPEFLTENIPRSLLPLAVIVLGFAIVFISFFITRMLTKFLIKAGLIKEKKKEDSSGTDKEN
jgi:hypothetical protein